MSTLVVFLSFSISLCVRKQWFGKCFGMFGVKSRCLRRSCGAYALCSQCPSEHFHSLKFNYTIFILEIHLEYVCSLFAFFKQSSFSFLFLHGAIMKIAASAYLIVFAILAMQIDIFERRNVVRGNGRYTFSSIPS